MKYFCIVLFFLAGCSLSNSTKIEVDNRASILPNLTTSNTNSSCSFKTNQQKDCWTRVGGYLIDQTSEEYACNLRDKGFNHIILAKYIGDNGALPNESAFVLYKDSEKEYVKEFFTSGSTLVQDKPIRELNWKSLRTIADTCRLDTINTRPHLESSWSHYIGFSVQYYSSDLFFCERLQDHQWEAATDTTHPKVVFWKELTRLLEPTTDR